MIYRLKNNKRLNIVSRLLSVSGVNNLNDFNFIVVGDIHKNLPNTSSTSVVGVEDRTGPPTQPIKFNDRFTQFLSHIKNEKNINFIVFNGDFIHSYFVDGYKQSKVKATQEIISSVKSILPNTKVYFSEGNHDNMSAEDWYKATGFNKNHSFSIGNYGFLIITSSNMYGDRQIMSDHNFIEKEFKRYRNKQGVFVFSHIPRFSGIRQNSRYDSPNDTKTLNLFKKQSNLKGVFISHFHEYDNTHVIDGVKHIFTGHIAHYGLNYYGYKRIEIDNNEIVVKQIDITNNTIRQTFKL